MQTATTYAFPLEPVAPATDRFRRRSEASLVDLKDGGFLLAYANHVGRSDNDRAFIEAVRLTPEGKRTDDAWVAVEAPEGGLNAMSPALRRLPDGRIGMVYSHRMNTTCASRLFIASQDEGRTWSDPIIVAEGEYKTGRNDCFTICSTGRFIAPCHCTDDWDKHYVHIRVAWSDDAGAAWSLGDKIELPMVNWPDGGNESGCNEPCVVERADGSLFMTMRTAMGTQFCSESLDGGETWTPPRSMEVISPQAPANLSRIPGSDDLLLVWTPNYNARTSLGGRRHTIMTCISYDGGRSWPHDNRKVLVHDPHHSVDYPSLLYKDGEAWITLRCSTGPAVVDGRTSTCLMRVPIAWFC